MSLSRNRWLGLAAAALVVGGMSALACGGDDTTPAKPVADAGKTDTGITPTPEAGADTGPAGPTIYMKLGGHAGVLAFVHSVVDDVLVDPEETNFFVFQKQMPVTAGHPTRAQIEECFTDLVGHFTGGAEDYPTKTPDGFMCRDMKTIHQDFHIPNGVFNDFVGIIAAHGAKAVTAGVITQKDLDTMAALLNSQQPIIVDQARGDAGDFEGGPAKPVDAGTDAPQDAPADG